MRTEKMPDQVHVNYRVERGGYAVEYPVSGGTKIACSHADELEAIGCAEQRLSLNADL